MPKKPAKLPLDDFHIGRRERGIPRAIRRPTEAEAAKALGKKATGGKKGSGGKK